MWSESLLFLEKYRQHTIYIGCSGGVDSMVLAHFLHTHKFDIHIVHINYHKRGDESDEDMKFVELFCTNNSIPFSVKHYTETKKGNFQENARKFRYEYFESLAKNDNGYIALAHHSDDLIETFFINLMRQSGILGLSSIPLIRNQYIRPLLYISKSEIINYALKNDVKWREDQSNNTIDYLRNKWRLEFIPLMEKSVPNLKSSTLELIQVFKQSQLEIEKLIFPIIDSINETSQIKIEKLKELSSNELFELWRQLKQPSKTFHRFEEIIDYSKGKQLILENPYKKVTTDGEILLFSSNETNLVIPTISKKSVISLPQKFDKKTIYLDGDKIKGEIRIRKWQEMDRIDSIGIKGSQLVSKIIRDAKISLFQKENTFIVYDDENIHWVIDLKVGRNAIATSKSQTIIAVSIKN